MEIKAKGNRKWKNRADPSLVPKQTLSTPNTGLSDSGAPFPSMKLLSVWIKPKSVPLPHPGQFHSPRERPRSSRSHHADNRGFCFAQMGKVVFFLPRRLGHRLLEGTPTELSGLLPGVRKSPWLNKPLQRSASATKRLPLQGKLGGQPVGGAAVWGPLTSWAAVTSGARPARDRKDAF